MKTIERSAPLPRAKPTRGPTWLSDWNPEDPAFFERTGGTIAWRTLWVTTFCLLLAFATWFMVSAIVTKLQGVGFALSKGQLFWLAAMPGLAAGTMRMAHTFLIPIFGTRKTVAVSTLLLVLPCVGWSYAVQHPETPYGVLLFLAFLAGLGGGNFSSFMPSTTLFFPKSKVGTALGIQAGVGNFGVSVAQFLIPAILGLGLLGGAQTFTDKGKSSAIYLQNAALIWIPFVLLGSILAWGTLKSVPVKATFKEQLDIFSNKHTWLMTSLYMMTFGSFSGLAAAFPLLIKSLYGGFPGAPDPLQYAFLGPLVGAAVRAGCGPIADRVGGSKLTLISGLGLFACAIGVTTTTAPTSLAQFPPFVGWMLGMFFFAGIGNASTFKQIPMIFEKRQAAGVIGWTSAVAAYGPFIVSMLLAALAPNTFFLGAAAFYAINVAINHGFYARRNAPKPC
ncbi:MAG: MFS transporter [Fimbriimonas sp.]